MGITGKSQTQQGSSHETIGAEVDITAGIEILYVTAYKYGCDLHKSSVEGSGQL